MIVVDSGVIIGALDSGDAHHNAAVAALSDVVGSGSVLGLPAIALAEVMVGPESRSRRAVEIAQAFLQALPAPTIDLTSDMAQRAAKLRARRGLALPDALIVATAIEAGADRLITTDRGWPQRLGVAVQVI